MSLGPLEIILLLVVIALIFGARKLPELGKGLGRGIKEFRSEVRDPEQPNTSDRSVTDVPSRELDPVGRSAHVQSASHQAAQPEHSGERRS